MAILFTTVNKTGTTIRTKGTYSLGRNTREDGLKIVWSDNYIDGTADVPEAYAEGDIIFVSPEGYLGMNSQRLGNQVLKNTEGVFESKRNETKAYINSKIG